MKPLKMLVGALALLSMSAAATPLAPSVSAFVVQDVKGYNSWLMV